MGNKLNWISFGNRKNSLLAANFKILAWSKGLEKEVGIGLKDFIINSVGDQFVVKDQLDAVDKKISEGNFGLEYIDKIYEIEQEMLNQLKQPKIDFIKLFDSWVLSTTYFYIATNVSYSIYVKTRNKKIKEKIEKYRNDGSLYKADLLTIKKIAKTYNLPELFVHHCTFEEVKKLVRGEKLDGQAIKGRYKKPRSLVLKNGKFDLKMEILNPLKQADFSETKIIKGQPVYRSNKKIQGIVGKDILVAAITKPDMVSKMRKMKAVITDEGGVLCHAAITAREFKIPTIVGTKVASKVFKVGYTIELDMSKGMIKEI